MSGCLGELCDRTLLCCEPASVQTYSFSFCAAKAQCAALGQVLVIAPSRGGFHAPFSRHSLTLGAEGAAVVLRAAALPAADAGAHRAGPMCTTSLQTALLSEAWQLDGGAGELLHRTGNIDHQFPRAVAL